MLEFTDVENITKDTKINGYSATESSEPSNLHTKSSSILVTPHNNTNGHTVSGDGNGLQSDDAQLIPGLKRKHADGPGSEKKTRAPSPPWKKIAVEGPTSFVVDGRRKSSRTNAFPDTTHSPSDKRKSRSVTKSRIVTKEAGPAKRGRPSLGASNGNLTNGHDASHKLAKAGRRSLNTSSSGTVKPVSLKRTRKSLPSSSKFSQSTGSRRSQRNSIKEEEDVDQISMPPPQSPIATSRRGRPRKDATTSIIEDTNHAVGYTKLRLKIKDPVLRREHPSHFARGRKAESFKEWLAQDDPLEEDGCYEGIAQIAEKDAQMRLRILKATEAGGALSEGRCTRLAISSAKEPVSRYGNWDFVTKHAANFSSLMKQEIAGHKRNALRLARAVKEAIQVDSRWAFLREAKSAEETYNEERGYQIKRYKQVVKDVELKWLMVLNEVNHIKLEQWEKEQEVLGNKALDEMLDQSTSLLQRQFRDASEITSEDFTSRVQSSGSDGDDDDANDDDMDMTDSDDEDEASSNGADSPMPYNTPNSEFNGLPDDQLTQEQLQMKYEKLLKSLPSDTDGESNDENDEAEMDSADDLLHENESDTDAGVRNRELHAAVDEDEVEDENAKNNEVTPPPTPDSTLLEDEVEIEEVDDILLDDSDESTDMSDDMGSADETSADEDDESEEDIGTAGFFFTGAQFKAAKDAAGRKVQSEDEADQEQVEETESDEVRAVPGAEEFAEPLVNGFHDHENSEVESIAEADTNSSPVPQEMFVSTPTTSISPGTPSIRRTEVSPLLRGSLREYQHDGVDWLAMLYAGGRNGILADEMGLGKTIQTIALLAHLASHHQVWGPHLVVVPTSVMLNWEMEFKKWCPGFRILTYYGSIEERKAKRRGWTNDDMWNVCITSYQLILQDAQAFKKRAWHYLILDEAHNIKNFQTQRWQTLLTFKTEARLLLTGTPLQNNLQELWSLLYFLMPAGIDGGGFAELETFMNSMKKPANQILDQGLQQLDPEAQARVNKLHEVLRPYLLRRLKSEVEKQMPGKYEHVVYCRLSKRQRQLYDEFMGRADTRRTLEGGNYMSVMNCLMSLRKVCNHPDLFETRQIVTSFAMRKSAVVDFEIKEMIVRRRLLRNETLDLEFNGLVPSTNERYRKREAGRIAQLQGTRQLEKLAQAERQKLDSMITSGQANQTVLAKIAIDAQRNIVEELKQRARHAKRAARINVLYGRDLVEFITLPNRFDPPRPHRKRANYSHGEWFLDKCMFVESLMPQLQEAASKSQSLVTKFGTVTPAVVAEDICRLTLSKKGMELIQLMQEKSPFDDPYHEARVRLSIAFPDKRLLQYDCGKLQALDQLLRKLQSGGHRCLIFTQMTKVLDILESFLNIHGHRYLRLDGATKIEQRQILTERFNNDTRISAFILSSRSGGLGINLTGADTVIFYDLDWNPAMDAQCQDRAHRIGQTRDVHIYRFVSEYTIEANILRKSNQKRLLDDVIIQRGEFTTDTFFNRTVSYRDALENILQPDAADDVANSAMDRVLGGLAGLNPNMLDRVEDQEDVAAAKVAQKEIVIADDIDFKEIAAATLTSGGAASLAAQDPAAALDAVIENERDPDGDLPHVDDYMVRILLDELKDQLFRPIKKGNKSKKKAAVPDWKRGK